MIYLLKELILKMIIILYKLLNSYFINPDEFIKQIYKDINIVNFLIYNIIIFNIIYIIILITFNITKNIN